MKKIFLIIASVIFTAVAFSRHIHSGNVLTNLEALQKGNSVQIAWSALTETNVSIHEIQKSTNGSSFISIGNLLGQNNQAPHRYTFLDATPSAGVNYYRIRTIDKQGNETFSNVLSVNNGYGRTDVRVLPNPVNKDVLNLQLININSGKYVISLYSNAGQKVFARSLDLTNGSMNQTINLPSNLGTGLYFLQLTNGEMRINKQIMIQ